MPSFPRSAPAHHRNSANRPSRARSIRASRRRHVAAAAHQPRARNKSCARRWGIRADADFRPRRARESRCFLRPLALFDQLPKLSVLAELIVFRHGKFAPEKKIPERVFVKDAVDSDPFRPAFEIDSVILRAITVKLFPFALDHAEATRIEAVEVLGQDLKFGQ